LVNFLSMGKTRRKVDIVVISDVHLGTYGCQAKELHTYLKSIKPKHIILNGDIIDIWQFKKKYWPKSHMKVVKQLLDLASKGTKITYIPGNHDETLRRFDGLEMGNLSIQNQLELDLNGDKVWFFHGDVFDVVMQYSKGLAKLGAISYDALILLNVLINRISKFFGYGKVSLSKRIKDNVKSAVKFINNFETLAVDLAIKKGYTHVVCGHIHCPEKRSIIQDGRQVTYLNSGDWVENLSALEYHKNQWSIYRYEEDISIQLAMDEKNTDLDEILVEMNNKEIFQKMLLELKA